MNVDPTELKLRRIAKRRGFKLVKSRARDPYVPDYGKYSLIQEPKEWQSIEEIKRFLDYKD